MNNSNNNKKTMVDISKYLGIPFLHKGRNRNGLDCYGLVLYFYTQEFGAIIPDYEYDENWRHRSYNFIQEEYRACWQKIDKPEAYCGVGLRMPGESMEHHLGIILPGLNSFLHSPLNQPTVVSNLSHPVWAKSTKTYYRLKQLSSR